MATGTARTTVAIRTFRSWLLYRLLGPPICFSVFSLFMLCRMVPSIPPCCPGVSGNNTYADIVPSPTTTTATTASMNATIGSTAQKGKDNDNDNDNDNSNTSIWSTVINDSNDYFWGNNWSISFTTHLTMDTELAKLSVGVSFDDPTQQCPHPYFRTRLSGIAIVHIPMDTPQYNQLGVAGRSNPSKVVVNGSVWIPTPGRYFLEVLLLHCTMDAYNTSRTSDELKRQCPLRPVTRTSVKDYSFTVDPFDRPQRAIDEWEADESSPSLFQAWVFAPRCSGSIYHVSDECTKGSLGSVNMVRTKFQLPEYLDFMQVGRKGFRLYKIRGRFDN